MKRIILAAVLILSFKSLEAQNVFARKSLTSVNVDQLGEDEILLFKQSFENKNMAPSEAINQLKAKGMKDEELRKLKMRLNASEVEDPEEQLRQLSLKLLKMQDSLAQANKAIQEYTALERLYVLDSNVFGADLFRNERMDFAPNLSIATPPNYRVGPGDQLDVTVYGYQEFNRTLLVEPSGAVNVPYVGVVNVSGLTVKEARAKLAQVFSANGYQTLRNGTSELAVNLKEVRSIDVTVVGAKVPGRYTVPGLASPYHVLHLAAGPADKGSYRLIQLIRNGRMVAQIDLYELLANGTKHDDLRLEDGDVIFIPTYAARVTVGGEFKRKKTFEVLPGETLGNVIDWSGGLTEQAFPEKLYIERVGATGFYAVVIDSAQYRTYPVRGGDFIVADTLRDIVRGRIAVAGGVNFPGYYALRASSLSIEDLLRLAGGLREDGTLDRIVVSQRLPDGQRSYRAAGLNDLLSEGDSVLFSTLGMFRREFEVTVRGEVHEPRTLPFGEGLTAWDAILLAGGFTGDADQNKIEVAHLNANIEYRRYAAEVVDADAAKKMLLRPGDAVSVRFIRVRAKVPSITLIGEVTSPGSFGLTEPYEPLRKVLGRSGGLTPFADLNGAFLIRRTEINVRDTASNNILANRIQREGNTFFNTDTIALEIRTLSGARPFLMQDGDELIVPGKQTTVRLEGAVFQKSTVGFNGSWNFSRYLSMAGGATQEGNARKAYVVYPNGAAKRSRSYVLWVKRPKVVPGSAIVVPEKPYKPNKTSPAEVAAIGGVLASLTTLIVTLTTLL
jgi:protein involved in polysaccharide export with SLBB domain